MRVEAPSGVTSLRRTQTKALGRSTASSRVTRGAPRISSRSDKGALSKTIERPSSTRWSKGRSGSMPDPLQMPEASPRDCGDVVVTVLSAPGLAESLPPVSSASSCGLILALGQAGSATQRPGRSL
jgi:hypothetical protein